jgi:hypothetical protein
MGGTSEACELDEGQFGTGGEGAGRAGRGGAGRGWKRRAELPWLRCGKGAQRAELNTTLVAVELYTTCTVGSSILISSQLRAHKSQFSQWQRVRIGAVCGPVSGVPWSRLAR